MRAEIDRDLAQAADRFVDHVVGIAQYLAVAFIRIAGRKRRNRHLCGRKQRPQSVVQIFRKTLPFFFLGTQHGVQYPPFADPPLTLGTGDVIENFLHQEHPDRETERSNDPCPDKELRRQPPLLQIGDLNVLPETQKRHAGQRDRKQHPRQVVFGTARQPDSDDRRNDLQDDGYDQQYLFNHCRIAV